MTTSMYRCFDCFTGRWWVSDDTIREKQIKCVDTKIQRKCVYTHMCVYTHFICFSLLRWLIVRKREREEMRKRYLLEGYYYKYELPRFIFKKIRNIIHSKLFDDYFLVVDTTILIVVPIVGNERTTRLVCCILLK